MIILNLKIWITIIYNNYINSLYNPNPIYNYNPNLKNFGLGLQLGSQLNKVYV